MRVLRRGRDAARPRWRVRLAALSAVLVVLLCGAELGLRALVPRLFAAELRDRLQLSAEHPVQVKLLGASVLLPALAGRLGEVELMVPDVQVFEGVRADLRARALSIPFTPTAGELSGASVSATIPSRSMGEMMALITDGLVDQGEVLGGELLLGRSLELFGDQVQLTASIKVTAERGDLLVEPVSVNAAGFQLSTEELRTLLGPEAASLFDTRTVCVRDRLPSGVTLTRVELHSRSGGSATLTASLDPDLFVNPKKQSLGECGR